MDVVGLARNSYQFTIITKIMGSRPVAAANQAGYPYGVVCLDWSVATEDDAGVLPYALVFLGVLRGVPVEHDSSKHSVRLRSVLPSFYYTIF